MKADIKGALEQINRSWNLFEHKGTPMRKHDVIKVLKYGLEKGYKHTGELSDKEIDEIINPL